MSTVDEYHKYARDCLGGPPGLGPKKQRMQFLSLAHDWTQAALGLQGVVLRPPEPDPRADRQRRITRTLAVLVALIIVGYALGLIWWPELMPWSR